MIYVYCFPPQALIPLASDNTGVGKIKAAQALAKITITSNPEIAFPGERVRIACCKKCSLAEKKKKFKNLKTFSYLTLFHFLLSDLRDGASPCQSPES